MADFIETRSFLASNIENLLEEMAVRRQVKKIEADDLFSSDDGDEVAEIKWNTQIDRKSKIEVLLQEKESLGLYVSGNPLDDYRRLLEWVRETSARDDIYLILIDKVRKIFTKTNSMMFTLQISTPDENVEGIIFPKNALRFSPLLEEKQLYWIKGKIQASKKSQAQKHDDTQEESEHEGVENNEDKIKEYDELPKLIIDELVKFEEGILPLFESEDIPLAVNRQTKLKLNWAQLLINPHRFDQTIETEVQKNTVSAEVSLPTILLPKSLGVTKFKEVMQNIKPEKFMGAVEVRVEVERTDGIKAAKGSFWVLPELLHQFRKE